MNGETTGAESKAERNVDVARKEILAAIDDFEKANRRELLEDLVAALGPRNRADEGEEQGAAKRNRLWKLIAGVSVIFVVAAAFATLIPPTVVVPQMQDLRILLTFLAFVVALASYLASVARESIKRLGSGEANKPQQLREGLFYLATAEVPLVLAGVLGIVRLFTGPRGVAIPYTPWYLSFDAFLLCLLAVILLWMARLHLRIWRITKPWEF